LSKVIEYIVLSFLSIVVITTTLVGILSFGEYSYDNPDSMKPFGFLIPDKVIFLLMSFMPIVVFYMMFNTIFVNNGKYVCRNKKCEHKFVDHTQKPTCPKCNRIIHQLSKHWLYLIMFILWFIVNVFTGECFIC